MRDYNFFEQYSKKKSKTINARSPFFIALIIIILGVVLCLGAVGRNIYLAMQLNELNEEILIITSSKEYIEANSLQQSLDAMKQYDQAAQEILKKFQESDLIGTEIMKTLTGALPGTVTLTSVTMDNANASFVFAAPDRKAAAELLTNLKECGLFQEVELNSITSDPNSGALSVTVNAVMKAGEIE